MLCLGFFLNGLMDSWFLMHSLVYKDKIKVACWYSVGYERNKINSQQVSFEDYKISREALSSWVRIFYILKLGNKTDISFSRWYRYPCYSAAF